MSSTRKPSSASPATLVTHGQQTAPSTALVRKGTPTLGNILETNVEHSIVERPSHEELETEVVHPLAVGEGLALLGAVPLKDQAVAEGQAGGRVGGRLVAVEHAAGECGLDMADDLLLELVRVLEAVHLVLSPCHSLGFGDRSCDGHIISCCFNWGDTRWSS